MRDAGAQVDVVRSDRSLVAAADRARLVVLSPGPGRPEEYPHLLDLLDARLRVIPFFGICLGMQAIGWHLGVATTHAPRPMHGKRSTVHHDGGREFNGIPTAFEVMRYHSLRLNESELPPSIAPAARSDDGVLMAIRSEELDAFGVQFHPESFRTPQGGRLVANLLA